jgi:hypothetical protein
MADQKPYTQKKENEKNKHKDHRYPANNFCFAIVFQWVRTLSGRRLWPKCALISFTIVPHSLWATAVMRS